MTLLMYMLFTFSISTSLMREDDTKGGNAKKEYLQGSQLTRGSKNQALE